MDAAVSQPLQDDVMEQFVEEMGQEISLLVRCNEDPTHLLMESGRALPPLTQAEKDDVRQLIVLDDNDDKDHNDSDRRQPTAFLRHAVETMFRQYASSPDTHTMGRSQVAQWFTVCTGGAAAPSSQKSGGGGGMAVVVGPHDGRVQEVLAKYGAYGTGMLTLDGMLQLYLDAVMGGSSSQQHIKGTQKMSWKQLYQVRKPDIEQVWRDIRAHGIIGPVELERQQLLEQLERTHAVPTSSKSHHQHQHSETLMDECTIVDESFIGSTTKSPKQRSGPRSSHELVELADDGTTPLWMKDGDFGTYTQER